METDTGPQPKKNERCQKCDKPSDIVYPVASGVLYSNVPDFIIYFCEDCEKRIVK